MHVLLYPSEDEIEPDLTERRADLHGYVGSYDDSPPPDDSRRPIGFRVRERIADSFPRGPSYSIDGKTWTACDLRDAPS